jgi:hypothetical protein
MTWTLSAEVLDVLAGRAQAAAQLAEAIDFFNALPEDSLDLVHGSCPYEKQRLYLEGGIDLRIARNTEEWAAWMVRVFKAALRACRGLVAFVVGHGVTRKFSWSGGPALLMANLIRAGVTLRRPVIYNRVSIPGNGGDWLSPRYEFVVCATKGGRLFWADPTALGHPPFSRPAGR